jgi:hypothetical protein
MKKPSTATSTDLQPAGIPVTRALRSIMFTGKYLALPFSSARGVDCDAPRNPDWLEQRLRLKTRAAHRAASVCRTALPLAPAAWAAALGNNGIQLQIRDEPQLAGTRLSAWPDAGLFRAQQLGALAACDLVLGFERPQGFRQHLRPLGRRFLSLRVHPLQLLGGLCFGLSANCDVIAAAAAADCALRKAALQIRARWMPASRARAREPNDPSTVDTLPEIKAPNKASPRRGPRHGRRWTRVADAAGPGGQEADGTDAVGENQRRNSLGPWALGALRCSLAAGSIRRIVGPGQLVVAAERPHLMCGLAGLSVAHVSGGKAILGPAQQQQQVPLAVLQTAWAAGQQDHVDFSELASGPHLAAGLAEPQAGGDRGTPLSARSMARTLQAARGLPQQQAATAQISAGPDQLARSQVLRIGVVGQLAAADTALQPREGAVA